MIRALGNIRKIWNLKNMESWKEELYHHGIKGQKWGVRRYQNYDGTLTEQGRKKYLRTLSVLDIAKTGAYNNSDHYHKKGESALEKNNFKKAEEAFKLRDSYKELGRSYEVLINKSLKEVNASKEDIKRGKEFLRIKNGFQAVAYGNQNTMVRDYDNGGKYTRYKWTSGDTRRAMLLYKDEYGTTPDRIRKNFYTQN